MAHSQRRPKSFQNRFPIRVFLFHFEVEIKKKIVKALKLIEISYEMIEFDKNTFHFGYIALERFTLTAHFTPGSPIIKLD